MKQKRESKDYTRREFLKYSGRVGTGAVAYGALGGTIGNSYRILKDYLNKYTEYMGNKLVDLDNRVDALSKNHPAKVAKDAEKWRGNFLSKIFNRTEKDKEKFREEYNIKHPNGYEKKEDLQEETTTRRGFFKNLINYAHNNPIKTGVIAGGTYGGLKGGIGGIGKYLDKRKIAILKDESTEYKERVEVLENYKNELETEIGKLKESSHNQSEKYEHLKKELFEVKKTLSEKEGNLEKKLNNEELIAIGLIGFVISIVLSSFRTIGFSILERGTKSFSLNIVLFIFSILVLLIGLKNKFK